MSVHGDEVRLALETVGVSTTGGQSDLLASYLERVLETNRSFNLTAIREWTDAVWLHLVDSLLALPEVEAAPLGSLVDLGSGAGFPGVPLAVMTARPVLLVESVQKKANFATNAARDLGIGARGYPGRAEDLAREQPESFAIATARALTALPSLVELASPLLAEGGVLVAYKGDPGAEEIAAGKKVARLVGMDLSEVRRTELPYPEPSKRVIVVFRKTRGATVRLPRRTGLAQSQPLA